MPGTHIVQNRLRMEEGGMGLNLPFPQNATGRFMLPRFREIDLGSDLLEVGLAEQPICGTVDASGVYCDYKGIWTESISESFVVVIVERDDANGRWTNFCFHQLGPPSLKNHTLPDFEKLNPNRAHCWAVIAVRPGEYGTLIEELKDWGVPENQIGAYVSQGDFTFGFQFEGGYFGEVKSPRMPTNYQVQDRKLMQGGMGLDLPFPENATGRLMLPSGSADLQLVKMNWNPTCGRIAGNGLWNRCKGIWTESISDCVVVVIAEPDDAGQRWSKFCFQHMPGGEMKNTLEMFKFFDPNPARCWAVFADKSESGYSLADNALVKNLVKWGVPATQIKWYTSGGDFTFGFRFEGGYLGEVKPPYGYT